MTALVVILISSAVFLIVVKIIISKRFLLSVEKIYPHETYEGANGLFLNGIKVGNAQEIGDEDFQSSYFAIVQNQNDVNEHTRGLNSNNEEGMSVMHPLMAVITEGIRDDASGRAASIIATDVLRRNFKSGLHRYLDIESFFEDSFEKIQVAMRENVSINVVGVKLAAVIVDGGVLSYAAIGDCVLVVLRDGELIYLTNTQKECIDTFILKPFDIAMLASKGAFESLTEMEIIWCLELHNHPIEKSQMLLKRARKKGFQLKNWVIIILEHLPTANLQTLTQKQEWVKV